MKKALLVALFLVLGANMLFAQGGSGIGINGGVALPTGDFTDWYSMGIHANVVARLGFLAVGGGYTYMMGKEFEEMGITWEVEDAGLVSAFVGVHIGQETGLYLLPAAAVNVDDGFEEFRIGADLGGGYILPMGNLRLEIGGKFCMTNILLKEEGEIANNLIKIYAGIIF